MKAKITRAYKCSPNGYEVKEFKEDDVVDGIIAEMALSDKAAVEFKEPQPQVKKVASPSVRKTRKKAE